MLNFKKEITAISGDEFNQIDAAVNLLISKANHTLDKKGVYRHILIKAHAAQNRFEGCLLVDLSDITPAKFGRDHETLSHMEYSIGFEGVWHTVDFELKYRLFSIGTQYYGVRFK